jgi:hypothetical protein
LILWPVPLEFKFLLKVHHGQHLKVCHQLTILSLPEVVGVDKVAQQGVVVVAVVLVDFAPERVYQ